MKGLHVFFSQSAQCGDRDCRSAEQHEESEKTRDEKLESKLARFLPDKHPASPLRQSLDQ